ncbi:MAG: ABC transporter permease [bacterium]
MVETNFGVRRIGAVNWLGLWTLYKKEVRRFIKVMFQTVLAPVISTLLFLFVFMGAWGAAGRGVVMEGVALPVALFLPPGLIMMAILSNAFQNSSSSLIIAKVQGSVVDILMPPLSPAELTIAIVAGAATRGLLVGLVTALTIFGFSYFTFNADQWHLVSPNIFAILYFAIMASLIMGMIGAIAGMWAEKFDQLALITNFVITPLTFLSGTFYSMKSEWLPDWVLAFSQVNPVFYLIDGFRFGFLGVSDANPMRGAIIVTSIMFILGLLTYSLFRSGYKLKS